MAFATLTVFRELPDPPALNVTDIQSGEFCMSLSATSVACTTDMSPLGGKISYEKVCLLLRMSAMRMVFPSCCPVARRTDAPSVVYPW